MGEGHLHRDGSSLPQQRDAWLTGHYRRGRWEHKALHQPISLRLPADFVVERNIALHTTESRLHPMLNHGMDFTLAGKKIPFSEGAWCSNSLKRP